MTTRDDRFQAAIAALQAQHKLPATLSPRSASLLQQSFNRYADQVGQRLLDDILSDFQTKISEGLAARTDGQRSELLYNLSHYVGPEIADRLRFGMDIAEKVSDGAGRYLNQNLSEEAVQEYPALALTRYFPRTVPRGWKRVKGTIIPVPDEDWPSRWAEAGALAGDDEWLPWEGDSQHGRGIALKSSGIWSALGTLRDDSLGNPFPPFAFNSGFMTQEINRPDTIALGLLKPGQRARMARIGFDDLFAPIKN